MTHTVIHNTKEYRSQSRSSQCSWCTLFSASFSPLQICKVCSRSRHGLYHSRYL